MSNYTHQSDEQFISTNVLEKKICSIDGCIQFLINTTQYTVLEIAEKKYYKFEWFKAPWGINYVSIMEQTGEDAEERLNPRTQYDMMEKISKAIRIKLKSVKNEFNGSLMGQRR